MNWALQFIIQFPYYFAITAGPIALFGLLFSLLIVSDKLDILFPISPYRKDQNDS